MEIERAVSSTKAMVKGFKAIELFAGAGGLDLGLEKAGFSSLGLIEFDKDACETFHF